MKTSVIKPGLLVSLKTSIRGGVNYTRVDLEPEHADENGGRRARWETKKEIEDAQEFDRATQARGKARSAVSAICCSSSFGLLCPMEQEKELDAAVAQARAIAREHNTTAARCYIDVFVLVGRIAQTDEEAARALGAEVRELLDEMKAGVKVLDPEAIREAASKATALEAMLSEDVAGKVSDAIKEARAAAREIVKRAKKGGEQAAAVVAEITLAKLDAARFAFLDLDGAEVTREAPAGRALDVPAENDVSSAPQRNAAPVPQLALEV